MGESAGRTRGNTVRPSARRRMSDGERAKHTHTNDDPQEWPDEEINTTWKIAGRIGRFLMWMLIAQIAFNTHATSVWWRGILFGIVWICCDRLTRAVRWETTRRL